MHRMHYQPCMICMITSTIIEKRCYCKVLYCVVELLRWNGASLTLHNLSFAPHNLSASCIIINSVFTDIGLAGCVELFSAQRNRPNRLAATVEFSIVFVC
ncbi:hypothetical protein G1C95_0435 [Bifidobacterium sp. DSM 109957]|uniref:Uncharacterized protein n=1 Tax=Bifidobacterium oedipodis TaxID=2675322 RepID=A0A7Y0EN22_9BIFI|nr:hypothetical protein [Bifidobacterium sp. DSM 109957]